MLLYFLGTGAGKPSLRRNVTSLLLQLPEPNKDLWLFDCGEGTQHQMLASPFSLSKITNIFITHLHGDHLFGLPGLLSSRSFHTDGPLAIFGPAGLKEFLEISLRISGTHLSFPMEIHEVYDGAELDIGGFIVKVAELSHGLTSYGYRIEEPDRLGRLNVMKLQQLNIPAGPIYGQLKQGKTVVLDTGQVLDGNDFLGPAIPGRRIVILGDTQYCQAAINLSKKADVLVHEATYEEALASKAREYNHATTVQAALVAQAAKVNKLVLTHLSSRYNPEDYEWLLKEAQSIFPNTELAVDHYQLVIPRSIEENKAEK